MTRKPADYQGELAAPIPESRRPNLIEDLDAWAAEDLRRHMAEYVRKLGLLLDHHDVPRGHPNALTLLVGAMIQAHVPGMRTGRKRSRGQSQKWTSNRSAAFVVEVEALMADPTHPRSLIEACRKLTGIYGDGKEKGADTLERRYHTAKKDPLAVAARMLANQAGPAGLAEPWATVAQVFVPNRDLDDNGQPTATIRTE